MYTAMYTAVGHKALCSLGRAGSRDFSEQPTDRGPDQKRRRQRTAWAGHQRMSANTTALDVLVRRHVPNTDNEAAAAAAPAPAATAAALASHGTARESVRAVSTNLTTTNSSSAPGVGNAKG